MAIKGKRRSKGRRVIAASPRPQLVVRKAPIWRRPVTWVLVGLLALGGILTGTFVALGNRAKAHLKDREIAAIEALTIQFRDQLAKDLRTVPPDLIVFYPSFDTDMDALAKGTLQPADAITKARAMQASAKAAVAGISGVNIAKLIPSEFTVSARQSGSAGGSTIEARGLTQTLMLDAQFLMAQAFQIWQEAGVAFEAAANATGAEQAQLIAHAKELGSVAGTDFDRGYRQLTTIRTELGLSSSVVQQPTPSPSVAPSASPGASPSSTPSATP